MNKYLEYTVVMVFVSSILTLQLKYINMNKEIINNITETIIDELYEQTTRYMNKYGNYIIVSNNEFVKDQEKFVREVIKELNFRIKVIEEKENK